MRKTTSGFTIVELLIVIVVIAILTAITIVAYSGIQDRSNAAKAKAELNQLAKAMSAAKINSGRTIVDLTSVLGANKTGTGRGCWALASGTDLAALSKTSHACWTDYFTTLQIISTESGINVNNLIDPWGRPYFIDQSEGEYANPCQSADRISIYARPFVTGYNSNDVNYRIDIPFVANC